MSSAGLIIGIDATNLRDGGGVTHLTEILCAVNPSKHGITKIIVFGGEKILSLLENKPWLEKIHPPELNQGIFSRLFWQKFKFIKAAKACHCDLLFIPGGSYFVAFKPIVTMSRNMLPFEKSEIQRYGWSSRRIRLILLRYIQSKSMRQAQGVIFLTEYARRAVQSVTGPLKGNLSLIPHGLNIRFRAEPKQQLSIQNYSRENPYRIIYVSTVDQYKHQWCVVQAVSQLFAEGLPVKLDLIGPAHFQPSLRKLQASISKYDPDGKCVQYHGAVAYQELHSMYTKADLGVFASSCENMPNILLETMAAGLPMASSNRGPTPEILGEAGIYFDPLEPGQIASAIKSLIISPELRSKNAQLNYELATKFSWSECADKTFSFLAQIALKCGNKH